MQYEHAIDNLATAEVRSDTPRLVDVKGRGRLKDFSVKGEDFQQWSKKTQENDSRHMTHSHFV